jgi:hypothetical protein
MIKCPNVTIEGVKGEQSDYKAYGTTCRGRRQKGHGLPILKWYGMSSDPATYEVVFLRVGEMAWPFLSPKN